MKNQKGTSLVSVIVSFAVLMIVILLLQVSIAASGRYAARAKEIRTLTAEAENKYVDNDFSQSFMGTGSYPVSLNMDTGTGTEFWGVMTLHAANAEKGEDKVNIYYVE